MEVRVRADIVLGPAVYVREVAAAAARDQDLSAGLRVMFQHYDAAATLTCLDRTEEPGCARSKDDDVVALQPFRVLTVQPEVYGDPD
jgi:hypothetical protein